MQACSRVSRHRTTVLVVGGGPVGLYASSLLSAFGVPSILVDRTKEGSRSAHPRAHLINSRSMELLRQLGVEGSIREQMPPMSEWRSFRYCTSLLGQHIATQDHMASEAWGNLCSATSSPMAHLSQPKLETILRAEATRRAGPVGASFLDDYECVRLDHDDNGVRAELQHLAAAPRMAASSDRLTDDGDTSCAADRLVIEADHVLACDGAHSAIRRALGLQLKGPPPLQAKSS